MALARIITRSHACSRELALDLLARGYAVEIVSPDAVPDNIADLELRVEASPGDQLIASVEAHDGERSASLEFVHHLKAPMVDFIRRPPEPGPAVHFRAEPLRSNAEPSIEDVELPAEAPQLAAKTVSPAAAILRDPGFDPKECARLTFPPEPLPSLPVEPPSHFATEASTIARPTTAPSTMVRPWTIRLRWKPLLSGRSVAWYWRVDLSFAAVLLVAMVLGFGIRQNGIASAQSSGTEPVEKIAVPATDVDLLSAAGPEKDPEKYRGRDPGQASALAVSPSAMKSEANSSQPPKESLPAKAGATTARAATSTAGAKSSRRYGDDLVARDTVTYLDKRYEQHAFNRPTRKAAPAKPLARPHPSSHKRLGAVIAANKVTYLNQPAKKTAK